jgi:hypothetical protein
MCRVASGCTFAHAGSGFQPPVWSLRAWSMLLSHKPLSPSVAKVPCHHGDQACGSAWRALAEDAVDPCTRAADLAARQQLGAPPTSARPTRCSPSRHAGRAARDDIAELWPAARALLSEAHLRDRTDAMAVASPAVAKREDPAVALVVLPDGRRPAAPHAAAAMPRVPLSRSDCGDRAGTSAPPLYDSEAHVTRLAAGCASRPAHGRGKPPRLRR